jgi:hypothetical protein
MGSRKICKIWYNKIMELIKVMNPDHDTLIPLAEELRAGEAKMLDLLPSNGNSYPYGIGYFDSRDSSKALAIIAAREIYPCGTIEIGAMARSSLPKLKGLGYKMIPDIEELIFTSQGPFSAIAFANSSSQAQFVANGYSETLIESVPPEALALCGLCPRKSCLDAGKVCCDIILGKYIDGPTKIN